MTTPITLLLPELAVIRQLMKEEKDRAMSKELDDKIDASRKKLIATANQTVGMGNYKQIRRAYEEILLEVHNILDAVNEAETKEEGDK